MLSLIEIYDQKFHEDARGKLFYYSCQFFLIGHYFIVTIKKSPTMPTINNNSPSEVGSINSEAVQSPSKIKLPRSFLFPLSSVPEVRNCSVFVDHNFSDIKCIGMGSTARVHSAVVKGTEVALKIWKNKGKLSADRAAEFEFAVLSRLNHPNIVKALGTGQSLHRYLVMDYLPGGTLDVKFKARKELYNNGWHRWARSITFQSQAFYGPLNTREVLMYATEIACAMHYLHVDFHKNAMIIHRDLKPQNIGIDRDGRLKLFDFGACTCIRKRTNSSEPYEMTGNTGTPLYMAPEVALRRPYSEKVDIYSYGTILWQLATGEVPFEGMSKAEFFEHVVKGGNRPPMTALRDRPFPHPHYLPDEFCDLIQRCWHEDPAARPTSAQVLATLREVTATYNAHHSSSGMSRRAAERMMKGVRKAVGSSPLLRSLHLSRSSKVYDEAQVEKMVVLVEEEES